MDIRTLAILLGSTYAFLVPVIYFQYRINPSFDGIGAWAIGLLQISAGYWFAILRSVDGLTELSIILSNLAGITGPAFIYAGSLRFFGRRERLLPLVIAVSVYFLFQFYFTYLDYHFIVRSFIQSIASGIILLAIASVFFRVRKTKPSGAVIFLAVLFLLGGIVFVGRAATTLFSNPEDDFFTPSAVQYLYFLSSLASGIFWTFGFVMLINGRLHKAVSDTMERFELVFDVNPEGVIIAQVNNGTVRDVNSGFVSMTGFSREEVKGQNILDLPLWHHASEINHLFGREPLSNCPDNFEIGLLHKNGSRLNGVVLARSLNLYGKPHLVLVVRNTTDEKIQKLIKDSRLDLLEHSEELTLSEMLRKTLDHAEILTGSDIGFFHFVNSDDQTLLLQQWSTNTVNKMCSMPVAEMSYKISDAGVWVDCYHQGRPVIHNNYNSLENRKGLPEGHSEVRRELLVPVERSGKIVAILGVGNKPTDYDQRDVDSVMQLADLAWDIVVKKRTEEDLRKSEIALRKSNQEKDRFFSIIAHDLRGPFNIFLGFTQVMEEDLAMLSREEIRQMAVRMRRSAGNLYELLENLLEWSRLQRKVTSFNPETINLRDLILKCTEVLREPAEKKGITIDYETDPLLEAFADRHMIETIMRNLVSNSIKFTGNGGNIRIVAQLNSEGLPEVSVMDSGIGMSPEMKERIFEYDQAFSRTGTNGEPSTGLGLILCREFVEKHGGELRIESEEGKGSTFSFIIGSK